MGWEFAKSVPGNAEPISQRNAARKSRPDEFRGIPALQQKRENARGLEKRVLSAFSAGRTLKARRAPSSNISLCASVARAAGLGRANQTRQPRHAPMDARGERRDARLHSNCGSRAQKAHRSGEVFLASLPTGSPWRQGARWRPCGDGVVPLRRVRLSDHEYCRLALAARGLRRAERGARNHEQRCRTRRTASECRLPPSARLSLPCQRLGAATIAARAP